MGNLEHLNIIKQGVTVWNKWREENPAIPPNLRGESLREMNLANINLSPAKMSDQQLSKFGYALMSFDPERADLEGTDLTGSDLTHAKLNGANFEGAFLTKVNFSAASLILTNFTEADLSESTFISANFRYNELTNANFRNAIFGQTDLLDLNLGVADELENTIHKYPSTISLSTFYKSHGKIPVNFLRGSGVPEDFIIFIKSLISKPIEFYSCFLSYSSKDQAFAEHLHSDLQLHGIRVWFAPEDLKIGDRFRRRIDDAIRIYDKLLLVISENSINSAWVEKEVETAFEKERQTNGVVLFPIRLDNTINDTTEAWAADIRRTRHIGDFSNWTDPVVYRKTIKRLVNDLLGKYSDVA